MENREGHVARPIIVALDVSDPAQALGLVDQLADQVGLFKVGLQLFTSQGPSIVRRIQERGGEVFLDLKLHDIPNTVGHAAVECGRLGARMMTLHTLGGKTMMKKARERVDESSLREGWQAPLLLGVTVLTSMTEQALGSVGISSSVGDSVLRLARMACQAGLDGVVASPRELTLLRRPEWSRLVLVTPGVRPADSSQDDQARTSTPFQAILDGADYLVIGRPITEAANPTEAAQRISGEIQRARIELK